MNEINNPVPIKCPCCGTSDVFDYDLCDVCSWENDPIQRRNPDYEGGANEISLNEARKAYNT